jgi:RecA-family ATPase
MAENTQNDASTQGVLQPLDAASMMAQRPVPLDFVVPGFLSGTVGVLVGAGGAGKSYLALETALSVTAGEDLFGIWQGDIPQGPVLYLGAEDRAHVFHHRLFNIGQHLESERPERYWGITEDVNDLLSLVPIYGQGFSILNDDMTRSAWMDSIRDFAAAIQARLIIVDTYNRALGGMSETDNAVAGRVLRELERLTEQTGAGILVVHHTNKASQLSGEQGNQGAARGASALTDNARFQLNVWTMTKEDAEKRGIDAEDRKNWLCADAAKLNYGPPGDTVYMKRHEGGVLVGGYVLPELSKNEKQGQGRHEDGGRDYGSL